MHDVHVREWHLRAYGYRLSRGLQSGHRLCADSNSHRDAHGNHHSDEHPNRHGDEHTHTDKDAHADTDVDQDPYSDPNQYSRVPDGQ